MDTLLSPAVTTYLSSCFLVSPLQPLLLSYWVQRGKRAPVGGGRVSAYLWGGEAWQYGLDFHHAVKVHFNKQKRRTSQQLWTFGLMQVRGTIMTRPVWGGKVMVGSNRNWSHVGKGALPLTSPVSGGSNGRWGRMEEGETRADTLSLKEGPD